MYVVYAHISNLGCKYTKKFLYSQIFFKKNDFFFLFCYLCLVNPMGGLTDFGPMIGSDNQQARRSVYPVNHL